MHTDISYALQFLNNIIPHKNWFIAGGCLASDTFNDIDVYFTTQEDAISAISKISTTTHNTPNAVTFLLEIPPSNLISALNIFAKRDRQIQFIRRSTGSHVDILEGFDLNKSRYALFPDGTRYAHPTTALPLHFTLDLFNKDTIRRYAKYVIEKGFTVDTVVHHNFVSILAQDTMVVNDYYDGISSTVTLHTIPQFRNYNQSLSTMNLLHDCIEQLPAYLRLKRYLYILQMWRNEQPPFFDTLSTEYLYAYCKTFNRPMPARVYQECPEYLV